MSGKASNPELSRKRAIALWRLANMLVMSSDDRISKLQETVDALAIEIAAEADLTYDKLRNAIEGPGRDDGDISALMS